MTEKRFTIKGTWGKSLNRLKGVICDNNNDMYITDVVYLLNSLSDENEQLKQQVKQLQQWNKCLAEKRHQELPYNNYDDNNAEKEIRDFLEHKILNCSDRG